MTEDLTDVQKKMIYSRGKRVKMRRGKKQTFDQRHYWGGERRGKIMDTGYKSVFNVEMCV